MMNSRSGFSKSSAISKTSATSAVALALALFCARTYLPEISQKLRTGKNELPPWTPDSALHEPVLPTKGIERISPGSSCGEVGHALEVTASGAIGAAPGDLLKERDCFETTEDTHSMQGDQEFVRELMEKHRAHAQEKHLAPGQETNGNSQLLLKEEKSHQAVEKQSDPAYKELLALVVQRHGMMGSSKRRRFIQPRLLDSVTVATILGLVILFSAVAFYIDVQEASEEAVHVDDEPAVEKTHEDSNSYTPQKQGSLRPFTRLRAPVVLAIVVVFASCTMLKVGWPRNEILRRKQSNGKIILNHSLKTLEEDRAELMASAMQSQSPLQKPFMKAEVSLFSAGVAIFLGVVALLFIHLPLLVGGVICRDVQEEVNEMPSPETKLLKLSGETGAEAERTQEKVPVAPQTNMAAQDPIQFVECFAMENDEFPESPELADSYDIDWAGFESKPHVASCDIWPCRPSHLRGFMHAAIVMTVVALLASLTSQLRRAVRSQSEQVIPTIDDELVAYSAKHQGSQMPDDVTVLFLSVFAVLGGVIFSFDVQDALAEEASDPAMDKPSKEATQDKDSEQRSDAHPPVLWPCTLFHLRGLAHSAVVVIGVLGLAFLTLQLRGALASHSKQHEMEVQTVDDELMALSAKHQGCQMPNCVTALLLSVFAVLGGVVISFDVHDAVAEEEETAEPVDESSRTAAKLDDDEQQCEAQSPALWPCTLFQLRGFMHSAIVVIGVLSLAMATSQLRRALASHSEQLEMEVQTIDDELMALSAKHQGSQVPNGVTALLLSVFAVLGGVVFSFDVQDALEVEDEAAETCVDEPSKEAAKLDDNEQQCEAQSPALWPCTLFQLRGSVSCSMAMHTLPTARLHAPAIVIIGVLGLAFLTLRGAVASQSEHIKTEVQTVDDELMALSANHQGSQVPNGVTALLLSVFAVLGGVVFSFDMNDAIEEEEQ